MGIVGQIAATVASMWARRLGGFSRCTAFSVPPYFCACAMPAPLSTVLAAIATNIAAAIHAARTNRETERRVGLLIGTSTCAYSSLFMFVLDSDAKEAEFRPPNGDRGLMAPTGKAVEGQRGNDGSASRFGLAVKPPPQGRCGVVAGRDSRKLTVLRPHPAAPRSSSAARGHCPAAPQAVLTIKMRRVEAMARDAEAPLPNA